jgi:hypothetical protein
MASQLVVRGYGVFGDVDCVVTRGYSCADSLPDCITTVKSGGIKNNRVTIFNGTFQYKNRGENQVASVESVSAEYSTKFDDARYYGRDL